VQAISAAASGKHVLCEKPLALSIHDALAIIEACRRADVVLATNHHLRNAATHRAIRQLVRDGAIGKALFARVSTTFFAASRGGSGARYARSQREDGLRSLAAACRIRSREYGRRTPVALS